MSEKNTRYGFCVECEREMNNILGGRCWSCRSRERYAKDPEFRERRKKCHREYMRRGGQFNKNRNEAIKIIERHEEQMADDPERLSMDFMLEHCLVYQKLLEGEK